MPKKHISVSQLTMHARCGEQFRRRYLEGEIVPPGIAAHVGSGVHAGAADAMRHKGEHGVDLAPNEVRDISVAAMDTRFAKEGALFTNDEKSSGAAQTVADARDRTAALAHYWACVAQPEYKEPRWIEEQWSIPLPNGEEMIGYVDLAVDGLVIDWKTGSRKRTAREAVTSLQLTAYAVAYQRQFGGDLPNTRLDCTIAGKETRRHVLDAPQTAEHVVQLARRINVFYKAVRAGAFVPCLPTEWFCDPRYCGFSATCPYFIPDLKKE